MAASPIEIVNIGLLAIGEDTIVSFDDPTNRARLASLQYPIQRKQLLRSYRWSFATKRAVLAPEEDAPLFGYTYKFLRPTDCLRMIGVFDGNSSDSRINYTGSDSPFKTQGRYILSEDNPLYLIYNGDVENTGDMDDLFAAALSYSLAMALAIALTNDATHYRVAKDLFTDTVRMAKAMSAIENTPETITASDCLDSRYNGSYGGRLNLSGF